MDNVELVLLLVGMAIIAFIFRTIFLWNKARRRQLIMVIEEDIPQDVDLEELEMAELPSGGARVVCRDNTAAAELSGEAAAIAASPVDQANVRAAALGLSRGADPVPVLMDPVELSGEENERTYHQDAMNTDGHILDDRNDSVTGSDRHLNDDGMAGVKPDYPDEQVAASATDNYLNDQINQPDQGQQQEQKTAVQTAAENRQPGQDSLSVTAGFDPVADAEHMADFSMTAGERIGGHPANTVKAGIQGNQHTVSQQSNRSDNDDSIGMATPAATDKTRTSAIQHSAIQEPAIQEPAIQEPAIQNPTIQNQTKQSSVTSEPMRITVANAAKFKARPASHSIAEAETAAPKAGLRQGNQDIHARPNDQPELHAEVQTETSEETHEGKSVGNKASGRPPESTVAVADQFDSSADSTEPASAVTVAVSEPTDIRTASLRTEKSRQTFAGQPSEVIVINVMSREGETIGGNELLNSILSCGLSFGAMNIFHQCFGIDGKSAVKFSLANILKPGTFDRDHMAEFRTIGVCLFLDMPIAGSNIDAFEEMLEVAKNLCNMLDAELRDDQRNLMNSQSIEYYRQRIRGFELRQLKASGSTG